MSTVIIGDDGTNKFVHEQDGNNVLTYDNPCCNVGLTGDKACGLITLRLCCHPGRRPPSALAHRPMVCAVGSVGQATELGLCRSSSTVVRCIPTFPELEYLLTAPVSLHMYGKYNHATSPSTAPPSTILPPPVRARRCSAPTAPVPTPRARPRRTSPHFFAVCPGPGSARARSRPLSAPSSRRAQRREAFAEARREQHAVDANLGAQSSRVNETPSSSTSFPSAL